MIALSRDWIVDAPWTSHSARSVNGSCPLPPAGFDRILEFLIVASGYNMVGVLSSREAGVANLVSARKNAYHTRK